MEEREERDPLTGVYVSQETERRIQEMLQENSGQRYHLALLHLWNMNEFVEEFGSAFAMAMVQNYAIILRKYYASSRETGLVGRVQKDTFLIFLAASDADEVERRAAYVFDKIKSSYFGRSRDIHPKLTLAF